MLYTLSHRFDIVHTHKESYVRFLAAGARIVHADSDPLAQQTQAIAPATRRADFRTLNQSADVIVAVSQYIANQYHFAYPFTIPIRVVNNGVDTQQFDASRYLPHRNNWRRQWQVTSADDLVFLYCGALIEKKGVRHLAQAFLSLRRAMPETHLVIVGSDNLWSARAVADRVLHDVTRQFAYTPNIHILGSRAHSALPEIYAAVDVVVVPSLLPEASPLVILEAMASAKPVIASAVGGIPELMRGIGTLVPAGSVAELTAAMKMLVLNPGMRQTQGNLGRQASLNRTWENMEQSVLAIYRELLSRPQSGRLAGLMRRRPRATDSLSK
jgi:glycosyltransferase involved in cell wall biosynthesis